MTFEDLYRGLDRSRHPVDLDEDPEAEPVADQVVYRLGFSSVPLPGIPDLVQIGRVEAHRAVGPIATQRVVIRQRHGLPIVFDKSMDLGVEVAANEVLTICQIIDSPPDDLATAFREWREEVYAACGVISAVLDDRIAVEERFEDAIQVRGGEPVSSADSKVRVRSFLPFDATEEEVAALSELGALRLGDLPELAQAARWYLRAAQEGPTADAIVFLWIAIEALTPHKTTSPKIVEAMLLGAGFDPAWLADLTVGRLAGLRADIVHKGLRNHQQILFGFYRLEAICRVLIRQAAGVVSSWPPALVPRVFEDAEEIERQVARRETVWHEGGLPAPRQPERAGLRWDRLQVQREHAEPPMRVEIRGELQPGYERRALHWIASGANFLDVPLDPVTVAIEDAGEIPDHVEMAVNRERMLLRPHLFTLPDPKREVRLGWLIQQGLAQMAVMRLGIDSVSIGAGLIELGGTWAGWRAFYGPGEPLEGEDLKFSDFADDDLTEVGGITGLAIAGSPGAATVLGDWTSRVEPDLAQIFQTLVREWQGVETFAELLAGIAELAQAVQEPPEAAHE